MRTFWTTISAAAGAMLMLLLAGSACPADSLPLRIAEGKTEVLMRRKPLVGSIEIHALFPQGTKVRLANSPRSNSVILEIKVSTPKKKRKVRKIDVEEGGILRSIGVAPGASTLELTFELASPSIPRYTWWRTKTGLTIVLPPLAEDDSGILELQPAEMSAEDEVPTPTETPAPKIDDDIRRILERVDDDEDTSFSAVDYWREHAGSARELPRGDDERESTPEPRQAQEEAPIAEERAVPSLTVKSIEFAKLRKGKIGILKIVLDSRPKFALERLSSSAYRVLLPGATLAEGAETLRKAPRGFGGLESARGLKGSGAVEIDVTVSPGTNITASPVGSEIWIGVAR